MATRLCQEALQQSHDLVTKVLPDCSKRCIRLEWQKMSNFIHSCHIQATKICEKMCDFMLILICEASKGKLTKITFILDNTYEYLMCSFMYLKNFCKLQILSF